MAQGNIYGTSFGSNPNAYTTWIYWNADTKDPINNFSVVTGIIYGQRNDGYSASAYGTYNDSAFNIDGTVSRDYSARTYDTRNSRIHTFMSYTRNVYHNANGTKDAYIEAYWSGGNASSFTGGTAKSTVNLGNIDRNAPSVNVNLSNITENSVKVSWSSNYGIDYVQYSLNNGNWINTSGNSFIINNLLEDTNYNLRIRIRRSYNQVWGVSSYYNFKTIAGTWMKISINGSNFVDAETYQITENGKIKIMKEDYKIIKGGQ